MDNTAVPALMANSPQLAHSPQLERVIADASLAAKTSLSPGSSLSSLSPPVSPYDVGPPPSYEEHIIRNAVYTPNMDQSNMSNLQAQMSELRIGQQLPHVDSSTAAPCGGGSPNLAHNRPMYSNPPPRPFTVPHLIPLNESAYSDSITNSNNAGSGVRRTLYADTCDMHSNPPLSPISESSSGVCNNLSGGNTRSVSAAVSDESVAGDSGVFEASIKKSGELDEVFSMSLESAQIQIKLKYEGIDSQLLIAIEQARNLSALAFPDKSRVCIKAALLPAMPTVIAAFATQLSHDVNCPKFNEIFKVPIPEKKLAAKTLQVHVWCVNEVNEEECLGCAQVSLADFDPKHVSTVWYNVLSFKFMQSDSSSHTSLTTSTPSCLSTSSSLQNGDKVAQLLEASSARLRRSSLSDDDKAAGETGREIRLRSSSFDSSLFRSNHPTIPSVKEESSDESTIISSQTSTLTRNQGPEDMEGHKESSPNLDSSDREDDEDESPEQEEGEMEGPIPEDVEYDEEDADDFSPEGTVKIITVDAYTNTDTRQCGPEIKRRSDDSTRNSAIKRSQTFSPAGRPGNDYICKLNRSDSDSSVPLYRRTPFQRNSIERRSLRWKKTPCSVTKVKAPPQPVKVHTARTSLDLELDLQASQTRLSQQNDEIARLRELKRRLEEIKAKGDSELPSWFTDNEQLLQFLTEADKVLAKSQDKGVNAKMERKAEHLLKKVMKEVHRLRQSQKREPDVMSFREKMAFFTTVNMSVPIIPKECDSETEDVARGVRQEARK